MTFIPLRDIIREHPIVEVLQVEWMTLINYGTERLIMTTTEAPPNYYHYQGYYVSQFFKKLCKERKATHETNKGHKLRVFQPPVKVAFKFSKGSNFGHRIIKAELVS
jgi:hypothetical protein